MIRLTNIIAKPPLPQDSHYHYHYFSPTLHPISKHTLSPHSSPLNIHVKSPIIANTTATASSVPADPSSTASKWCLCL